MGAVILGSGIIGLSTAYYLSRTQAGKTIHLVDSSPELFASASGYAGGFVARDWFASSVASLGQLSFDEHRRLAEDHGGREKWGYSRTVTMSHDARGQEDWLSAEGSRAASATAGAVSHGVAPRWLKTGADVSIMDDGEGTSIVDPLKLCHFLLEECKKSGVKIHYPATALGIATDMRDELASVRIGYTESVIYLAGVNSAAIPLPPLATGSKTVEASVDKLKDVARQLIAIEEGDDLEVVRTGLCFRPITPTGTPILDKIPDEHLGKGIETRSGSDGGVFVAVGHGPWGISLSLGTGKVMAEMMQGKELSADITKLGL
ncbi:Glycine/D-amino acid oxidase (deaminating) [Geosmithia morbida]|uniref:Glycine/D-amino acid oxidase (Deaminating) n=1 Tax=Geosmithia morbida TaxID=1094350 RepID=A0A9P4YTK5_9HYPO|nr:Glycine/D-amino acid oxidase (deaminating) [Geosmithia morbida]KAF4122858.1 Glycine/D-amino acid oxidase (deaminating) [Geosmithia morbida]